MDSGRAQGILRNPNTASKAATDVIFDVDKSTRKLMSRLVYEMSENVECFSEPKMRPITQRYFQFTVIRD